MEETKRYAVVTGSNKGIGYEICRQLACKGVTVVLTARDEEKGEIAFDQLKRSLSSGISQNVIFHQLDVKDSSSIATLAEFINTQFGRLDILVNNAGVLGAFQDINAGNNAHGHGGVDWAALVTTYELAEDCLQTNYYGTRKMVEAFLPLLQRSDSPSIVNVSSAGALLKNIKNEWAKSVLRNVDTLTEEKIDEVLNEFLKDCKQGSQQAKSWAIYIPAYVISKAAINAYTRILAKSHTFFRINCVCPGSVKTDIVFNTGVQTPQEGAENLVKLALLPNEGPSGVFFIRDQESSF